MAMQGCRGRVVARLWMRARCRARGVTFIELLVVLALLAVLVAGATASFAGTLARHRAGAAGSELSSALVHARTMALVHGRRVTLCPSADLTACNGEPAPDWRHGWIAFIDRDHDGVRDDRDALLEATRPRLTGLSITGSGGRRRVQFLPDGRAAGSTITFHLCGTQDQPVDLRVIVSNVGRVRREAGATCAR